jgi:hypothetical protein
MSSKALALDEEGVVVPNDVGGVDGQELGERERVLRLGPEVLHLVCYLHEVSRAIFLVSTCYHDVSAGGTVIEEPHAICSPFVAFLARIYELWRESE